MSRIDYYDGDDALQMGRWIARAKMAIGGKRGQAVLRELEAALLAMPEKILISGAFCKEGDVCVLGALAIDRAVKAGKSREEALRDLEKEASCQSFRYDDDGKQVPERVPLEGLDALEYGEKELKLTETLTWELMEKNDEMCFDVTPQRRYEKVLEWVRENIRRDKGGS